MENGALLGDLRNTASLNGDVDLGDFLRGVVHHRQHWPHFAGQVLVSVGLWLDLYLPELLAQAGLSIPPETSGRVDDHVADTLALGRFFGEEVAGV